MSHSGSGIVTCVDVQWPDRRADVLNGLDALAEEPPRLADDELDPRWPDIGNAIAWVVDDTWWDHHDPREDIGLLLRDEREAEAVEQVVRAVIAVAKRQVGRTDASWFDDAEWPRVRDLAARAAAILRA